MTGMFRSFRARIFWAILLVAAVAAGLSLWLTREWLEERQLNEARTGLLREARVAGELMLRGENDLEVLARVLDLPDLRLSLLDADGNVLAETGGVVEGYYAAASMHQLAEKTGFTEADAETVKECLRTLFVNDASSARPDGSMEVVKLFWWKHNCKDGQYSSARVHRSVRIAQKDADTIPSCAEDYDIRLEPLPGLEPEIIDGI